jgi:hypothetical protein
LKILSHQVHRRAHQGLPARTETVTQHRRNSSKWLLKQAGEIQDRLTAELENQVINEATRPEKYSPMEF